MEDILDLKVGAQVIFVKNDTNGLFYNGQIGRVTALEDDSIQVAARDKNGKEYIIVNRDGDDYVYVMVNNVKVVAADPTNPKTGDMVLPAAMTMMMVSGLAAAAVYVIGKKRRV